MSHTTSPAAKAGSRRFWVTVLVFACANLLAWVGYHEYQNSRLHLLRVVRFQPGNGATVGARPTLSWEFNLDVAHGATKDASPDAAPGTITPHVSGKWLWHDGRTLTFTPDSDLPKATRFTIALPMERVHTAEGIRLSKPFSETISTYPLRLIAARQSGFDDEGRLIVELEFDDNVIPAEAIKYLTIKNPEWRPLQIIPHGDAAGKIVRVKTEPLPQLRQLQDSFVFLQIAPGLAGTSGPLGIGAEFSQRLPIAGDLMATSADASTYRGNSTEVRLTFNAQPDVEALRQVISVDPPVKFLLANEYENHVSLQGSFTPGARYAVKIKAAPPGSEAKRFPRPDVLSVFIPDSSPQVWFEHTEGYLGSQGNRTLLAHAENVTDLKATVFRVYDNNLVGWRNHNGARYWGNQDSFARPIAERKYSLPSLKNKTQDLKLSLDELLPPDAPRDGVYRIHLAAQQGGQQHTGRQSDEVEFDEQGYPAAEAAVTLSDIGLTAKQSPDGIHIWAVSLSTAKPLADVRVRAYSNKNQLLGEAKTDKDGLAKVTPINPAPGEHAAVLLAEQTEAGARLAGEAEPAAARAGAVAVSNSQRGLTWLDLNGDVNFSGFDVGGKAYLRRGFEAFIYTERGVYRPGETAHLRAIVRGTDQAVPAAFPVRWQLVRPDLRNWKAEVTKLDSDGAATLDVKLPDDLPTGRWTADLALPGENGKPGQSFGSVSFLVEEFVPNRMKINLSVSGPVAPPTTDRISIAGGNGINAQVQADYLFGKPVAERPATLAARVEPAVFAPKQWAGWTFNDSANSAEALDGPKATGGRVELPDVKLDAKGHGKWEIGAEELLTFDDGNDANRTSRHAKKEKKSIAARNGKQEYAGPWRVTFFASVIEAGGRAVNSTRVMNLDRATHYIGVRATKSTATPGLPAEFELASVASNESADTADAEVQIALYREIWNTSLVHEQGRYRYNSTRKLELIGKETKIDLPGGRGKCQVIPPTSGAYVIVAADREAGLITSQHFYASRGSWDDNISREKPEQLEVVVSPVPPTTVERFTNIARTFDRSAMLRLWHGHWDRPNADGKLRPGETAQVIVRAPFAGRLMLSVETDEVVSTQVIEMPESHTAVRVRVPDNCRPNAFLTATVIRAIDPHATWRTHRAFGIARIPLDNSDRKLAVQVAAPKEMRPGNTLIVDLKVTDSAGKPAANAAVSVAAVDEGILALTNFATPDPFAFFTAKRAHGVRWSDLYSHLMPEVARIQGSSPVGGDKDGGGAARHTTPVSARRVKPVALLSPILHTDAEGNVRANLQVPEFAGQLRVMAITYGGKSFGAGESSVFVRSPLLVQSSWPRFAAPEDRFTVPLVVFNNTASEGTAEISLSIADGGIEKNPYPLAFANSGEHELKLTTAAIKPGGQAIINFEMIANHGCGVAKVRLSASLNGENYNEEIELPVRPASPTISVGGYAVATPTAPAKIGIVNGMLEGTGELQVRAAPFPVLELPRGLEYLDRYPYGCAEQTISGGFPLVALGDLGPQIAPGMFGRERIEMKLQSGIMRLMGMQTADGGLSMWPGANQSSWPWASVYAAHFLVEAQAAGHKVPEDFRDRLMTYVRNQLNQATDNPEIVEVQAYASYVLALAGKPERAIMSRLTEIVNDPKPAKSDHYQLAPEARFHLAAAWLLAGRRDLAAGLIPQTLPQPRSQRQLSGNVGSPVRDRAVLLSTLMQIDPDHPAIPAMAQQLADAGKDRGWRSTQDAAFAVMALGKYLRQMKPSDPYEEARLFIDREKYVAEASDGKPLACDPSFDAKSTMELRITGSDKAKAYVSWVQTGVPIKPPADEDAGMKIRRRFLDVRGEAIVGATLRSGDLVQIELSIESLTALENVVIDDLLPAGFEIENARLESAADGRQVAQKAAHREGEPTFTHGRLDVRDDRLVVVGSLSSGGSAKFVYLARAVTPGEFVVPPVRGECMYDIGTHSISGAGGKIRVVAGNANAVAASK